MSFYEAPFMENLFLYHYEKKWLLQTKKTGPMAGAIKKFFFSID